MEYNYRSIKVKKDTMDKVELIRSYMNGMGGGYHFNKSSCVGYIVTHFLKLLKEKIKTQDNGNK